MYARFISHNCHCLTSTTHVTWSVIIMWSIYVWLHSSVARASHGYRGGHGFESRWSPDFFRLLSNFLNWKINCDDHSSLSWSAIITSKNWHKEYDKQTTNLLFSLNPFIFANIILRMRSRCSQVSSAMSTFPWSPVHRSASFRSSNTLFVLLSNWRNVLTRGKSLWPAWASSMRCW